MGVLNVTPDSFSGDGLAERPSAAVDFAAEITEAGADILDIGGESTRPGATAVPAADELDRLLPALGALAGRIEVPISVDTRKAAVAEQVLAHGADTINDVSGLADPDMAAVVAEARAGLVIVHNGPVEPGSDVLRVVCRGLERLVEHALRAGVAESAIVLDPGLGFGKTWRQNLEIVRRLAELRSLGLALLVGPSRKGTIGKVLGVPPGDRLEGTVALVVASIAGGADAVRVHDVHVMTRIARMTDALARGQLSGPA
jgi:dihydropteroate synthase